MRSHLQLHSTSGVLRPDCPAWLTPSTLPSASSLSFRQISWTDFFLDYLVVQASWTTGALGGKFGPSEPSTAGNSPLIFIPSPNFVLHLNLRTGPIVSGFAALWQFSAKTSTLCLVFWWMLRGWGPKFAWLKLFPSSKQTSHTSTKPPSAPLSSSCSTLL